MRHIFSLIVENKPRVLARISGLFSARGYNIVSLVVAETLDPTVSYMTIVVEEKDKDVLEQIRKQLEKLIDVITVVNFSRKRHIDRELILMEVDCPNKDTKVEIENVLDRYGATIIHHQTNTIIIEAVGGQWQIKQLVKELKQFGIKEFVRTGRIAIAIN